MGQSHPRPDRSRLDRTGPQLALATGTDTGSNEHQTSRRGFTGPENDVGPLNNHLRGPPSPRSVRAPAALGARRPGRGPDGTPSYLKRAEKRSQTTQNGARRLRRHRRRQWGLVPAPPSWTESNWAMCRLPLPASCSVHFSPLNGVPVGGGGHFRFAPPPPQSSPESNPFLTAPHP